jgi:hypothetical protein
MPEYKHFLQFFFTDHLLEMNRKIPITKKYQKNNFTDLAEYTPLKYEISRKPLISPEPEVEKFQIFAEMKINYPTNKKNTRMDFSDNFHNIKLFIQVDHIEKNIKNSLNFFCLPLPKNRRWPEKFSSWLK